MNTHRIFVESHIIAQYCACKINVRSINPYSNIQKWSTNSAVAISCVYQSISFSYTHWTYTYDSTLWSMASCTKILSKSDKIPGSVYCYPFCLKCQHYLMWHSKICRVHMQYSLRCSYLASHIWGKSSLTSWNYIKRGLQHQKKRVTQSKCSEYSGERIQPTFTLYSTLFFGVSWLHVE